MKNVMVLSALSLSLIAMYNELEIFQKCSIGKGRVDKITTAGSVGYRQFFPDGLDDDETLRIRIISKVYNHHWYEVIDTHINNPLKNTRYAVFSNSRYHGDYQEEFEALVQLYILQNKNKFIQAASKS